MNVGPPFGQGAAASLPSTPSFKAPGAGGQRCLEPAGQGLGPGDRSAGPPAVAAEADPGKSLRGRAAGLPWQGPPCVSVTRGRDVRRWKNRVVDASDCP